MKDIRILCSTHSLFLRKAKNVLNVYLMLLILTEPLSHKYSSTHVQSFTYVHAVCLCLYSLVDTSLALGLSTFSGFL